MEPAAHLCGRRSHRCLPSNAVSVVSTGTQGADLEHLGGKVRALRTMEDDRRRDAGAQRGVPELEVLVRGGVFAGDLPRPCAELRLFHR